MILPLFAAIALQPSDQAPTASVVLPKAIHSGTAFKATLKLHFAEGLHGYQNPPSDETEIPVQVKVASGAKLVSVSYPKGTSMSMAGSAPVKIYKGDISIGLVLKATKSGPVVFTVKYQQCNDSSCFPPSQFDVKANASVSK